MQATTVLIVEKGAHWIERALVWRTRANEAVVALIQGRAESARAFRGRVERRIAGLWRKGLRVEQIMLLFRPRRASSDGGGMLLALRKALAASAWPVHVLLVPRAPGVVAAVRLERPFSSGERQTTLHVGSSEPAH